MFRPIERPSSGSVPCPYLILHTQRGCLNSRCGMSTEERPETSGVSETWSGRQDIISLNW